MSMFDPFLTKTNNIDFHSLCFNLPNTVYEGYNFYLFYFLKNYE